MEEQILELEKRNLQPRPWHLQGEVSAKDRPKDSLLEEAVEFDYAGPPLPPPPNEEHTSNIEEMIKRRIINNDFDDLKEDKTNKKKKKEEIPEVSNVQSELGLAEIYERQYLAEQEALKEDKESNNLKSVKKDKNLPAEYNEISQLFTKICYTLDSLSNFHYTPRPPLESKPVSDLPALSMEEIIPLRVSSSHMKAPSEIYKVTDSKGRVVPQVVGDTEKTRTEEKRGRKYIKRAFRKRKRKNQ